MFKLDRIRKIYFEIRENLPAELSDAVYFRPVLGEKRSNGIKFANVFEVVNNLPAGLNFAVYFPPVFGAKCSNRIKIAKFIMKYNMISQQSLHMLRIFIQFLEQRLLK